MLLVGCATPLMDPVQSNDIPRIKALLDAGADINETANGYNHINALSWAIYKNATPETVKYLLDRGADVNKRNLIGWTPIDFAVYSDNFNLTKLLIDHGADIPWKSGIQERARSAKDPRISRLFDEIADSSYKHIAKSTIRKEPAQQITSAPSSVHSSETGQSDVDENIPEGEKAGKFDVAVVIGNRNYSAVGAPDVDFASRDARTMRDYLTKTMGFDATNIIYAEDAGLSRFYEIFGTREDHRGKLFKWVKPKQSKVFIYYVGHGAPDMDSSEAYFVPVDANPQFLKVSGYRVQTFYDNLAKIPAKKITVVLDACFSGNSAKGSLIKGTSALMRYDKLESRKPGSALVLTSSSADQVSSWYPEKKHSLFTYFFLKGLQGEADANRDARVTAGEMKAYLVEHVPYMARRLTGNEQTPQISGSDKDLLAVLKR